jgi:hypothetical protein
MSISMIINMITKSISMIMQNQTTKLTRLNISMARKANTITNIPKLILIMIVSATNLKALKPIKTEMI